jgi:hypothetical protein
MKNLPWYCGSWVLQWQSRAGLGDSPRTTMARRIAKSKRRLERGVLERQIGRLLERNARSAARYAISIEHDDASACGLRLEWDVHPEWDQWANLSEGTYILRSNVHDWTDEELWKTYIQLTEAEAVDAHQGAAEPPALAELVLVTHPRDLRQVAPGVAVKPGLDEPYAALVLMEYD